MVDLYKKLSKERKELQESGEVPEWFTTAGWQLFKDKYQYQGQSYKGTCERIAKCAAKHVAKHGLDVQEWETKFYNLLWKGWLSPSTPVLSNMGTSKGMNVSCSGTYVSDSVYGFYDSFKENAILTKHGFGTSGYLSDIRPRGSKIATGGKASGITPVLKHFVFDMQTITQGTQRRGAFAGYIDIEHKDFYEIADLIQHEPDDLNIGWIVKDKFIKKLQNGDKEANNRYKKAMKSKLLTGKGYFFFVDKVNRNRPKMYKDKNLDVKASNLCCEVFLHSSEEYSFSCVLSAMNLYWYDDWKDTTAVFDATVFLDCVAEEFITLAENIKGLEKTVDFTRKGRALGLGVCGFHTYLQEKRWPFEGLEAHTWNNQVFKHIRTEADKASKWMATVMGEPEWCAGYGVRNTHLMALMPTKACVSENTEIFVGDKLVSYKTLLANNNLQNITDIVWSLENGMTTVRKYNDSVNIIRGGQVVTIYAYQVQENDILEYLTIVKVITNSKQWFDIKDITVKTPDGSKVSNRIFYNGIEDTIHLVFDNTKKTFEIDCTLNHQFRTKDGEWVCAENITQEHKFDNGFVLTRSTINDIPIATFDIEIPDEHCYVTKYGIVSHNTALIQGGISEGINPDPAIVFNQATAAGEMDRISPTFLKLLKERNMYSKETIRSITDNNGSVQHLEWLTDDEKLVFRTAFEMDQSAQIRLCSTRQKYVDQGQSINLFFSADEDEKYITKVHQQAFLDENLHSLYYIYTLAGVQAAKSECIACS